MGVQVRVIMVTDISDAVVALRIVMAHTGVGGADWLRLTLRRIQHCAGTLIGKSHGRLRGILEVSTALRMRSARGRKARRVGGRRHLPWTEALIVLPRLIL
jgi:hypothetical protein